MHRSLLSVTDAYPLHVLCACDTFKGTLPSDKVGEAVEAGYRQAWTKLSDLADPTNPSALTEHTLPAVTRPPLPATTHGEGTVAPPVAAEALARSLFAQVDDDHHHRHQHHQDSSPEEGNLSDAASAATRVTSRPTVDFSHTPMSDGGAGLLDSVTFADSREAHATAKAAGSTIAAGVRNPLHLRRVYVPASTTITGPLGSPIPHVDVSGTPPTSTASTATGGGGGAGTATAGVTDKGVSFACDVARRVLVVEMAEAAGLPRIAAPQDRNPTRTTSYGVGELIRYALRYMEAELQKSTAGIAEDHDREDENDGSTTNTAAGRQSGVRLFLGIGGSSTNDGGLGALQALGLEIFVQPPASSSASGAAAPAATAERDGVLLREPFRGGDLGRITHIHVSDAMLQLFPYLRRSNPSSTTTKTDASLFIAEVCLICDVDNPLVGPHGATYTFGPQKCAPPLPPPSTTSKDAPTRAHAGDDAAVGAIASTGQKVLLDALEAGMRHAATRVVASTWRELVPPSAWPHVFEDATAVAPQDQLGKKTVEEKERNVEAAMQADVLYQPGGGGAGGMSGFFRYLLGACYVPGADMVGGLLGLYETPHVAQLLGSDAGEQAAASVTEGSPLTIDSPAFRHPRGCLCHACDVVVSGEGSFDDQTISSHKTVGRLLEMCTTANAYRLWRRYCSSPSSSAPEETADAEVVASEHGCHHHHHHRHHGSDPDCRMIQEFVIVCGRTNFDDYATCQSEVVQSVCRTLTLPLSSTTAPAAAESKKEKDSGKAECDGDTVRVSIYLHELCKSPTFRADYDAQHHRSIDSSASPSGLDTAEVLKRLCVPRVTVLPLTPTLFSFADATQRAYACVTSAVADLLEDSARQIACATATTASSA